VKQISAKPALLAATVFALSYAECGGGVATLPKLNRPAHPATSIGKTHRRVQGVVGVAPQPYKPPSLLPKASRRQLAMKQKQKTRAGNREATHRKSRPRISGEMLSKRQRAMIGLASFYSEDHDTASGERFDRRQLSGAHPSLPFGTRLRVTNLMNGKCVTVRINDRGPFVHGRIIDVTLAAAEALRMIDSGVAKVTLDIVR
jgi:rare lipoprotein A